MTKPTLKESFKPLALSNRPPREPKFIFIMLQLK